MHKFLIGEPLFLLLLSSYNYILCVNIQYFLCIYIQAWQHYYTRSMTNIIGNIKVYFFTFKFWMRNSLLYPHESLFVTFTTYAIVISFASSLIFICTFYFMQSIYFSKIGWVTLWTFFFFFHIINLLSIYTFYFMQSILLFQNRMSTIMDSLSLSL